jgi:hypothetical protein
MTQGMRTVPELARLTARFTISTRGRLTRALMHTLRGRSGQSQASLRDAVVDASLELRAAGLGDESILSMMGGLVEDAGRACGADRPSLLSGELRWLPVRRRVLESVSAALAVPLLSPVRAMGMAGVSVHSPVEA